MRRASPANLSDTSLAACQPTSRGALPPSYRPGKLLLSLEIAHTVAVDYTL